MDSTVAGDDKPEEKPDEATSGEMTAPEEKPPAENPPADRPPGKRNWILIALIAVSCVAVLLFASTITLAVTGGCGHHGGHERFERPDNGRMGPMHGRGEGGLRDGSPWRQKNQGNQNKQAQPPQRQPTPQSSQTQPAPPPGQGL
ncbi:MAG: hypothetical protein MUP40_05260 [Actinobacteria bacterium]|nr:hypothetical protein [Actinomycetota bacterium]